MRLLNIVTPLLRYCLWSSGLPKLKQLYNLILWANVNLLYLLTSRPPKPPILYIAGFVGSTNASYVTNWLGLNSIAEYGERHSSYEGQLSLATTVFAFANHGISHSVLYQLWGSATTFPLLFLFYQVSTISSWETLFLDEVFLPYESSN